MAWCPSLIPTLLVASYDAQEWIQWMNPYPRLQGIEWVSYFSKDMYLVVFQVIAYLKTSLDGPFLTHFILSIPLKMMRLSQNNNKVEIWWFQQDSWSSNRSFVNLLRLLIHRMHANFHVLLLFIVHGFLIASKPTVFRRTALKNTHSRKRKKV